MKKKILALVFGMLMAVSCVTGISAMDCPDCGTTMNDSSCAAYYGNFEEFMYVDGDGLKVYYTWAYTGMECPDCGCTAVSGEEEDLHVCYSKHKLGSTALDVYYVCPFNGTDEL